MIINLYFQLITLINFFSNIYIFFLLFIFGYLEIVSEGFVVISLITIFTHGFSENIRNIYLGTLNAFNLKKIILFRIFIGVIGLFLTIILSYIFIGKSYILFHFSLIFLTITNWNIELILARFEKTKQINIYYNINSIFFLISSLISIFINNIFLLSIFIFLNSFLNILIFLNFFRKVFNQNLVLRNIKFNVGIFSTLFKTLINFFWRYFIITFVGKSDASILFIGFALGSFFGTLFDISYGSLFLKKIKNKNLFINSFFIAYIFVVFLFIYFIKILSYFENEKFNNLLYTTIFSISGVYFLILSLRQRQLLFEKIKFRAMCYKADIYINFFHFLIVPFLYYLDKKYLTLSYFASSLFSYYVYSIIKHNAFSKKIT
jgi:hypothetical protein